MNISGTHKTFKREDGTMHPEERRATPAQHLDRLMGWMILGLLGWLCLTTNTLQTQVATLIERATNTQDGLKSLQTQIDREADDRKAGDAAVLALVNPKK